MRTSVLVRLVVMGVLLLALMIPLTMVQSVVTERASRRDGAVSEIAGIWGPPQTLGGPVLAVPYQYSWTDRDGVFRQETARAYFLPEILETEGNVEPEIRHRSLFQVVVYKAHLTMRGRFGAPDLSRIQPKADTIQWNDAALILGVSEPRSITRRMTLTWGGRQEAFAPAAADVGLFNAGVQAPAPAVSASSGPIPFSLEIDLNGSREIHFLPAGGETSVQLTSSWPSPSFGGAPLPESQRTGANGFNAVWRAPYFGRSYPAQWSSVDGSRGQLKVLADASAFGVTLLQPVDIYQQAERAVKYAALFIVLTFVIAFLWEIAKRALLHPIQYLFVGFAMCIFYLLLVSLSEHIGFDVAYLSAAAATVTLLAWYWGRALGSAGHAGLMGTALAGLYGFLYLLLRLEDYALLAGSIGLFLMLALVMFMTRGVNWYELRFEAAGSNLGNETR